MVLWVKICGDISCVFFFSEWFYYFYVGVEERKLERI